MSQLSTSSAHLAAISHDPLEEGGAAGLGQTHAGDWRSGGESWRGGARGDLSRGWENARSYLPSTPADALRPALLAGAIGLFAAWVVSGMGQKRREYGVGDRRASGYVADRDDVRPARRYQPRGVGPEGASSPQDEQLDALNP